MTAPRKPAAKTTVPAGAKKPAATKSAIPANAKKPQDRQTASAEVENEITQFDWRGTVYDVDLSRADDFRFFRNLEKNRFTTAVEMLLGEDQLDTLIEQTLEEQGNAKVEHFEVFLNEYLEFAKRGN